MADQRLVDYIRISKQGGKSDSQIINELQSRGWPQADIYDALSTVNQVPNGSSRLKNQNKLSITEKLKTLFAHPSKFFDYVAPEQSYMTPALYFVIANTVAALINQIISIFASFGQVQSAASPFGGSIAMLSSGFSVVMLPVTIIIVAFISFIGIFMGAGITHLGVLIFGGRKGMLATFKPVSYAAIINTFYVIINQIIITIFMILFPPDYSKIAPTDYMTGPMDIFSVMPTGYWVGIGIIFLVGIIAFIHIMVAEVIGISKYHQISKAKAFFGAILIPLILFGIVMIFIGAMAYFAVLTPTSFLPNRCQSTAGLDCIEHSVSQSGEVSFILKNNLGHDILIEQQLISSGDCPTTVIDSIDGAKDFPAEVKSGDQITLQLNCGQLSDERFKNDFTLNYVDPQTSMRSSAFVQISGSTI